MRVTILAEIKSSSPQWVVARPISTEAPHEWRYYDTALVSHSPLVFPPAGSQQEFAMAQFSVDEQTAFWDGFL